MYLKIVTIFISFCIIGCSTTKINTSPGKNKFNEIPDSKKFILPLNKTFDNNTKDETCESLFIKGTILYRKNHLKEAKSVMEKAKTFASFYDSSWNEKIQTGLRYIFYDMNDFARLYNLEKEQKELNPFINFLNKISNKKIYEIKIITSSNTVPLKGNNNEANDLKIPVTINGSGEENFIFDTGSNLTIISEEIAKKYKIYIIEADSKIKYGLIDSLQLGDVTIFNVPVGIVTNENLSWKYFGLFTNFKIDGIIGLPIIRSFNVIIDYPNKILTLNSENLSYNINEGFDMYFVNSFIYIPVEINKIKGFNFCLDTGGEMTELYQNGLDYLKQNSKEEIIIAQAKGNKIKTIYDDKDIKGIYNPKYFQVNNYLLENNPLIISPSSYGYFTIESHGNLGLNILKKFKITLDFKNMKILLNLPNG